MDDVSIGYTPAGSQQRLVAHVPNLEIDTADAFATPLRYDILGRNFLVFLCNNVTKLNPRAAARLAGWPSRVAARDHYESVGFVMIAQLESVLEAVMTFNAKENGLPETEVRRGKSSSSSLFLHLG